MWSLLIGVVVCVAIVVAGNAAWPNSSLCVGQPLQDIAPVDYPNPRCPDPSRFGQDQGPSWYYWRLPETTVLSQALAWIFYALHQLSIWGMLFYAQSKYSSEEGKTKEENQPKYSHKMRPINWAMMGINTLFQVLHLVQTHVAYDALAPSVHEMSSQGSVILMLCFILMMETDRRGMFFGYTVALDLSAMDVVKRYHGYIFSWGVIYTFWYHPMENYMGHLFGFMHVWIVMAQGSLAFTHAHKNRYWRMLMESWVFLHGTVIATQTIPSPSWAMFCFGFGAVFVVTQVPGLPIFDGTHWAFRLIPCFFFIIAYVLTFTLVANMSKAFVVTFIPMALWLGAIGLNIFVFVLLKLSRGLCSECCKTEGRPTNQAVWIFAFFLMFFITTLASALAEQAIDRHSSAATPLVYAVMCIVVPVSIMFIRQALPAPKNDRLVSRNGWLGCCSLSKVHEEANKKVTTDQ